MIAPFQRAMLGANPCEAIARSADPAVDRQCRTVAQIVAQITESR
jgi:hypothetical protein